MRKIKIMSRCKKDLKRQKKRGKKREKFEYILGVICQTGDAPEACHPHKLIGNWTGYRECHIEPDWLLIYTVEDDLVTLHRTGSHSDLF